MVLWSFDSPSQGISPERVFEDKSWRPGRKPTNQISLAKFVLSTPASTNMGSSKHNKDNKGGGKDRGSTSHAHDGNKGNKGNRGAYNANMPGGGRKKEEIVPWGWEAAQKAERKQKAAENIAKEAAAKALREYDPANVVQEKRIRQPDDTKGKTPGFDAPSKTATLPPAK